MVIQWRSQVFFCREKRMANGIEPSCGGGQVFFLLLCCSVFRAFAHWLVHALEAERHLGCCCYYRRALRRFAVYFAGLGKQLLASLGQENTTLFYSSVLKTVVNNNVKETTMRRSNTIHLAPILILLASSCSTPGKNSVIYHSLAINLMAKTKQFLFLLKVTCYLHYCLYCLDMVSDKYLKKDNPSCLDILFGHFILRCSTFSWGHPNSFQLS